MQFYPHFFVWIKLPTSAVLWTNTKTAIPQQFYGHFSVYPAIFSTFCTKLLTLAVLWTLFGVPRILTCGHVAKPGRPWQFYGQFSVLIR